MNARLRYFAGVHGLRDAHRRYRELAKRLHPDNQATGRADWFTEMAAEYAAVIEALRARRMPAPIEPDAPPIATPPAPARKQSDAGHTRRSPGLNDALRDLADAAGAVVAEWLKGRM